MVDSTAEKVSNMAFQVLSLVFQRILCQLAVVCRPVSDNLPVTTGQQRENMCDVSSTSPFMYWWDFGWKNLYTFFITPKMKTYLTETNHICWRKCGGGGANHHHIFWSHSNIQLFWMNIWKILQQIFKHQALHLGDLPEDMTGNDNYLLKILTVAVKTKLLPVSGWRLMCLQ